MAQKFCLEFEETPALVLVIHKGSGRFELYQNGKRVSGIVRAQVKVQAGHFPTHEIEFATQFAQIGDE